MTNVLDRLHAAAEAEDELAKQRVRAREVELGERLGQAERYELYGDAPLAITREVGELLYMLALSRRARWIAEFGASLGISTIYLAAAVADYGVGSLITTELRPSKAEIAHQNLEEAGLAILSSCGSATPSRRSSISLDSSIFCSSTAVTISISRSSVSSSGIWRPMRWWSPI